MRKNCLIGVSFNECSGVDEDVLLGQSSSLLLHVKPGNPKSAQQTEAAGLGAVGGQSELHLQQSLKTR